MYFRNNFAIVIPSSGDKMLLNRCLDAIVSQTTLPHKVILVLPKGTSYYYNKLDNLEIYYSKFKNQVFQRNIGISKFDNKIKVILQIDDKVILDKDAINKIIKCWNLSRNKKIAGIGFNNIVKKKHYNFFNPVVSFLNILFLFINSKFDIFKPGTVLLNGMCVQYENLDKITKVFWLKGGLSSYDLTKVDKNIIDRPFPLIKWSVLEDLIFSYKISKKYDLIVCPYAKAHRVIKNVKNFNLNDEYCMGKVYSQNLRYFIKINKNLSFILFITSTLCLVIFGVIRGLLILNFNIVYRNLGRFCGIFSRSLFDR